MIVQDLPVPYDRRTWLEARTLTAAGYVVSVICPKDATFRASYERREGIDIYRYPLPFEARGTLGYAAELTWCFVMSALLSLRVRLTGKGFDAIHSSNPPDAYWLLALAWRPIGSRFLFDHHDLSPEMYLAKFQRPPGWLHRALLWLERMSFRTADVTIATNESYRDVACSRGGRSPDSVFVVRSGPDGTGFRVREPEPALKEGRPFLCCYLGKMCEQDGVDYLLRTVAILTAERRRRDILFAIIGTGPALPELRRLAAQLGIDEHCRFTGYLPEDEVSRWLSTADLGIDPDPHNPWSDRSTMNKVLDYMFFGCPVVGFDLTENRRSAGDAGLFVTPNSEVALADAIEALLADEPRRRRMGTRGRDRVRGELLWTHSEPSLLAAYARLLPAGGGRA
jgi:glycosyltransferase involved in cell wall biosynthesis